MSNKLLKALLESKINKIILAEDGQEALAKLEQSAFDLVVSDVQMPRMDGFTMTLRIRSSVRLKHIPVILYSAFYTTNDFARVAFQNGADKFVRKNGSTLDIVSAANEFIASSQY
jgi:two-component system chemotaxis sensor kinase CheA